MVCWRLQIDKVNRTTSTAKSRDAVLRFPAQTLSSPWPHLQILSQCQKQDRRQGAILGDSNTHRELSYILSDFYVSTITLQMPSNQQKLHSWQRLVGKNIDLRQKWRVKFKDSKYISREVQFSAMYNDLFTIHLFLMMFQFGEYVSWKHSLWFV